MRRCGRIAVFWVDEELYDLASASFHAKTALCNYLYFQKRLYKAMPPTPNMEPWVPVCDHNNVGEYLQDIIVNGVPA